MPVPPLSPSHTPHRVEYGSAPHISFPYSENLLALRKFSKITNQDKIFDRTIQRRQHSCTTYRLQHHINNPFAISSCEALLSAFPNSEAVACTGRSGKGRLQISPICKFTRVMSPSRQLLHLPEIMRLQQQAGKVPAKYLHQLPYHQYALSFLR